MHIRIDGALDYHQQKQHIPHAFTVPASATRLSIRFDYSPKASQGQSFGNDLSLTLFDPEGARGARHNNRNRDLTITAQTATPGYLPGTLQPGVWTVWIDTHRVLPPDTIHYFFEIELSAEPLDEPIHTWTKGDVAPRGRGWYRGDLHGHTLHSDGAWDVPDLVQYARDHHLDFVTLTDHNTVSGLAQIDSLASDDLLTMGGMELTTYYGHALALGVRQWLGWRAGVDAATMPELAERVQQAGGTFVIAHPMSLGDPFCTGCDWAYPDMMPGNARCVEIWNEGWNTDGQNERALELWYSWLNENLRMVATRGSDIHRSPGGESMAFNIVYADELNEAEILAAVRKGHLYISAGPILELTAQGQNGSIGMVGDLVTGTLVHIRVAWSQCQSGDHLRLVVDGRPAEEFSLAPEGEHTWTLVAGRWCTVEVRRPDGEMRAVTNPIFLGEPDSWR